MNGDLLMVGATGLVQHLLLASIDVVLLGALVWGFLRLFRRCPSRLAALLWLVVLAKPLVTLAAGPAVSALSIPLPWGIGNVDRSALASATNYIDESGLAESHQPETLSHPIARPMADVPPTVMNYRIEGPAQPSRIPMSGDLPETQSDQSPVATNEDSQPVILSDDGDLSAHAGTADQRSGSMERIAATAVPIAAKAERPIREWVLLHRVAHWCVGVMGALWALAVTWGVAIAGTRLVVLRRRIALCPTADGNLGEAYDAVLAELGCRGRPARLVVGDSFNSPALIGCWRPVIVLPKWFAEQEDASQLRWVLRHEVTHLLHGDHWADLVRRTARTLLFFHPVVRVASRRWEEATEAACDRALVRGAMDVVDYTTCLLSIVQRVGSERKQTAPLGLFATQTQIQRRVSGLLALKSSDFAPLGRRYRWLLLPAALLMLCGFSLAQQSQDEMPNPTPASVAEPLPSVDADLAVTKEPTAKPAEADRDPETAKLLARTLEANRYWFDGPPQRVPGYRYTFVHRDGKRQAFTVADPQAAGAWVKRGITYRPLAAVLLEALLDSKSTVATIEAVERSDEQIQVRFLTDGSLGSRLGGGVSGSWSGYIYYKLGSGTLRLDAKTLMPIELTSIARDDNRDTETIVTERLSEPFQVDSGHWVPLRVEAIRQEREFKGGQVEDESTYRFDWAFRVYEPGLWLFDAEPTAEETAIGYHVEDVVIDNIEGPIVQASSSTVATIRESNEQTTGVVQRYVEANRAWLLPDLKRRTGLAYDYAQEDGYRERVIFDSAGNVLAQLASDRQSNETPSPGRQHLFTADGREADGMADEPFLSARSIDPTSTSPFSGRKMLHNLATGWGWECASMRLARGADDFGIGVQEPPDEKTRKLTLRPVRNKPTLHIGTMLRFISWAYLPSVSFERCEIELDSKSQLPIAEKYFRDGKDEPFCTIRFEDWLDTSEGKAPGKVIGRATYRKRGERDPQTREYEYLDEVFRFTGTYRATDGGLLLLDEVVSTFESTSSGSAGRVTLVEATDESYQPLREALRRLHATSDFLASVQKAPRGLTATVPCRWGETVPVWLNGKYAHQATGQGDKEREPPYVAYRKNLGIQDLHPELLAAGKMRVIVNIYSTLYYEGHAFDLTLGLVDSEGLTLVEQTASETTQTMARPEQKPIVFDFESAVDSDKVASIRVSLRIKRQWGSGRYTSRWLSFTGMTDDREIAYLPGGRDWGPEQVIGEPTDRRLGGDYKHAWSPLTEDTQQQWLEVTYRHRVKAIGVNIYETFNPGAVHRVTYYDASGEEQVAWEGDDPTPVDAESGRGVSKIRFENAVDTDRVRIYLDSPRVKGWNEIDAVGLVQAADGGLPEREFWVRDAKASSTFADGPRPETVTYQYDGPHSELRYDDGYRDSMRSLGGGLWQVIRFTRSKDRPYLDAVRVLASSYGSASRNATFYVLDADMNVLSGLSGESRIRDRGTMKWYAFHAPSVEVPETFHIGFQLNSQQQGGVYVATRQLANSEAGHSFSYDKEQGLKPLAVDGADYDWMIRAYLAEKPNEKARADEETRKQREAAQAIISAKGRGWGPEQAIGKPDAYDSPTGGDRQSAWASKTKDALSEWLELTYAKQVKAVGVDIYETFNPGAVNKVTVFVAGGEEQIAWEGTDPTPVGIAGGKGLSKIRFDESVNTDRIRIYLDSVRVEGWNEIDAVGLVASETRIHWATSATASSSYAK